MSKCIKKRYKFSKLVNKNKSVVMYCPWKEKYAVYSCVVSSCEFREY